MILLSYVRYGSALFCFLFCIIISASCSKSLPAEETLKTTNQNDGFPGDPNAPQGNCPTDYVFQDGICAQACSVNSNCPKGFVCHEGKYCEAGVCDKNSEEICDDNYDNNCDGLIDELDPVCGDGTQTTCMGKAEACGECGICATANKKCNGELYLDCDLENIVGYQKDHETTCKDNVDNDCDCLVDFEDSDCGCNPKTAPKIPCELNGVGVCKAERSCIDGAYQPESACDYGIEFTGMDSEETGNLNNEGKDICADGKDNDCDGQSDECCPADSCNLGDTQCKNEDETEVCEIQSNGCPGWTAQSCDFGCVNNSCRFCNNTCSLGDKKCFSSNVAQECEYQIDSCPGWTSISCQFGCDNNECKLCADEAGCSDHSNKWCQSNALYECQDTNGDGCFEQVSTACQFGCANNACIPCLNEAGCSNPSNAWCSLSTLYTCTDTDNNSCYEQNSLYCPYGCANGACNPCPYSETQFWIDNFDTGAACAKEWNKSYDSTKHSIACISYQGMNVLEMKALGTQETFPILWAYNKWPAGQKIGFEVRFKYQNATGYGTTAWGAGTRSSYNGVRVSQSVDYQVKDLNDIFSIDQVIYGMGINAQGSIISTNKDFGSGQHQGIYVAKFWYDGTNQKSKLVVYEDVTNGNKIHEGIAEGSSRPNIMVTGNPVLMNNDGAQNWTYYLVDYVKSFSWSGCW